MEPIVAKQRLSAHIRRATALAGSRIELEGDFPGWELWSAKIIASDYYVHGTIYCRGPVG